MKFVAIMEQEGEGCDYTIGCGISTMEFSAESAEAALEQVKKWAHDYSIEELAAIRLYVATDSIEVPLDEWKRWRRQEEWRASRDDEYQEYLKLKEKFES